MPQILNRKKTWTLLLVLASFTLIISGCSWFKPKNELEVSPQALAIDGMKALQSERYTMAVDTFQKLKDRHPYSRYALLAELKIADAYYFQKNYLDAADAYENFEILHPKNEAVPYAVFQQGMCHFNQMNGLDREQDSTYKAIQTFNRVIETFPDSKYAAMAEAKLLKAQHILAGHEFYIGEFYFKKKKYKAAQARFISLVKSYPDTGYHGRALAYITACKELIAQEDAAEKKLKQKTKPAS